MTKSRRLCYLRRCRRRRNDIQVMCDHLRSIVRSRTRTLSLSVLWPQISAVVRDTILGPRGESGEGGRKGRYFADNGMLVTEVEILDAVIEDGIIAEMMRNVQRESVTLNIGDRQAQEAVASAKLRAELERQRQELQAQTKEREAQLAELIRKLAHEARLAELRERELVLREQTDLTAAREQTDLRAKLEREAQTRTAQLEALGKEALARAAAAQAMHHEEIEHLTRVRHLEIALIEAQSRAMVADRTAVQPQLVEALTALGDKALLSEVAQNMNLVSLFRGKEAGDILKEVIGGTRFAPALQEALAPQKPAAPKK